MLIHYSNLYTLNGRYWAWKTSSNSYPEDSVSLPSIRLSLWPVQILLAFFVVLLADILPVLVNRKVTLLCIFLPHGEWGLGRNQIVCIFIIWCDRCENAPVNCRFLWISHSQFLCYNNVEGAQINIKINLSALRARFPGTFINQFNDAALTCGPSHKTVY